MTNPVALWGIVGLVLCAAEMVAPGVFLLWLGLAACGVAAAAAAIDLGWHQQLALFVALSLALIGVIALRKRTHPRDDTVNAPSAGLIGTSCTALDFRAGEGRVVLRDGSWQARTADHSSPASGDRLRIVGLDGTILLVAPTELRQAP